MDDPKLAWAAIHLLRGGVAPRHVRRCVAELRAHRADLIEQLRAQGYGPEAAEGEADVRLGTPVDFITATLARPELRGWAARAPWLVFAVLPLVAFAIVGVSLILLVIGYVELMGPAAQASADPALWRSGAVLLVATVQWALPLGVSCVLLLVAWRSRTRPVWPAFGLLLVVGLGALLTLQLSAPVDGVKGALSVGIGYPPRDLFRAALLLMAALGGIAVVSLRERRSGDAER